MMKKLQEALTRRVEPEKLAFWRIFLAQVVLFFAIYGIMLAPRFSTDAYTVFFFTKDGLNALLGSGRPGTYLLYRAFLALGVNSVALSPVFTAVFILAVAWSATVVLSLLKPYFSSPSLNWATILLVELGVVLAYANVYFAELYFFSDVAMVYALAVIFMTLALILFCWRKRIAGTVLALVCLYISLSFYQAFLGFFMTMGAMLALMRHVVTEEGRKIKPLAWDLLRLVIIGGGSSVASVLVMGRLAAAGFVSDRGASLGVADILNSIRQANWQFGYYYPFGFPSYLPGLSTTILVLSGPVLLCVLAGSFTRRRQKYPFASLAITLAALLCGLLAVFAPHAVTQSVWMTPRSICGFFAVFTVMTVVIGYNYAHKGKATIPWTAAITVLLVLAVNIVGTQRIALDQMKVNRRDRAEAETIVQYIEEYEAETGERVDTISWSSDGRYTWTHPEVKTMFMDMNVRAGARSWSLVDCIGYYAGRPFGGESMPDEVWTEYFAGQEWSSFQPEEQIRFEGNKMYLMVY